MFLIVFLEGVNDLAKNLLLNSSKVSKTIQSSYIVKQSTLQNVNFLDLKWLLCLDFQCFFFGLNFMLFLQMYNQLTDI